MFVVSIHKRVKLQIGQMVYDSVEQSSAGRTREHLVWQSGKLVEITGVKTPTCLIQLDSDAPES